MAKLELTYHQAFPEDGDPGWHAGWMPDGRRVHATPMRCNPGEPHWAGSVEDLNRCECNGDGTCNLCLIREERWASVHSRDGLLPLRQQCHQSTATVGSQPRRTTPAGALQLQLDHHAGRPVRKRTQRARHAARHY